jgi:hypothetical protein
MAVIFAARMTLPHFSISAATSLLKMLGAPGSIAPAQFSKPRLDLWVGKRSIYPEVELLDDVRR